MEGHSQSWFLCVLGTHIGKRAIQEFSYVYCIHKRALKMLDKNSHSHRKPEWCVEWGEEKVYPVQTVEEIALFRQNLIMGEADIML